MAYNGYSEARKKANLKYLSSVSEIRLRMTAEEKREIEKRATAAGLSVNQYCKNLVLKN